MCPPAEPPIATLPIATLRPPAALGLRRTAVVDLDRWLAARGTWLRPRAVPLVVAFAGLLGMLGAVKAVGVWSLGEPVGLSVHARRTDEPRLRGRPGSCGGIVVSAERAAPIELVLEPLAPDDHYIVLSIESPTTP